MLSLPKEVKLVSQLREVAVGMEGALIIERAPDALKCEMDVWGDVGDALGVMCQMKNAWDPRNTLSPGRFVGGI